MKRLFTVFMFLFISSQLMAQIGGNALKFNGSTDYVGTSYTSNLDVFTIECWVKGTNAPTGVNPTGVIHKNGNFQINWDHGDANYRGAFLLFIESTWYPASFGTLEAGVWYHLVGTYDGHEMKAYKNGTLITTNTGPEGNPDHNSDQITIAKHASGNYFFNGTIDEVRIWDDVRTESEIKTNMYKELTGNEDNLVLYYKMSDGSGSSLTNNKSGGTNATIYGTPNWVASGCFAGSRNCLDFDGNNDNILMPQSFNDVFHGLQHFSFCGWVYCSTLDPAENWGTIFSSCNSSSVATERVIIHQLTGGSKYKILFSIRGASTGSFDAETTNDIIKTGVWQHYAIVYDGTMGTNEEKLKIYIDGIQQSLSFSATVPTSMPTTTNSGYIASNNGANYFKGGKFDEFSFWSKSLTESEIHEMMFRNLEGNETDLFAYYRFDESVYNNENDGTTLYDITGNGRNGTLTNMDGRTDWVSSSAFNTWIGSESQDWAAAANWSNGVPTAPDNIGLYKWALGNELTISGTPTVNHILFSSSATPTISSSFTVNGNLLLQKNLNIGSNSITLGSSGYLSEGNSNLTASTGTISTTRSLGTQSSLTNIAGLGLQINSSSSLGTTTITRGFTFQTDGGLSNPISRYYDITFDGSFSGGMAFNYKESELTGVESSLSLYKSTNAGSNWTKVSDARDVTNNLITANSLISGTRLTAADEGSPLPVELSSFTASSIKEGILLEWQTATEINNYGFEIQRAAANNNFETIGFVAGNGNSNSIKSYSFIDNYSSNEKLSYRLKQIDNDGKFVYSDVVEITNTQLPTNFELYQNYPNPFNPNTTIKFDLPEKQFVTLKVYDILGKEITTLVNETLNAGTYQKEWNPNSLSSGVYIYRLQTDNFTQVRKMNFMK